MTHCFRRLRRKLLGGVQQINVSFDNEELNHESPECETTIMDIETEPEMDQRVLSEMHKLRAELSIATQKVQQYQSLLSVVAPGIQWDPIQDREEEVSVKDDCRVTDAHKHTFLWQRVVEAALFDVLPKDALWDSNLLAIIMTYLIGPNPRDQDASNPLQITGSNPTSPLTRWWSASNVRTLSTSMRIQSIGLRVMGSNRAFRVPTFLFEDVNACLRMLPAQVYNSNDYGHKCELWITFPHANLASRSNLMLFMHHLRGFAPSSNYKTLPSNYTAAKSITGVDMFRLPLTPMMNDAANASVLIASLRECIELFVELPAHAVLPTWKEDAPLDQNWSNLLKWLGGVGRPWLRQRSHLNVLWKAPGLTWGPHSSRESSWWKLQSYVVDVTPK